MMKKFPMRLQVLYSISSLIQTMIFVAFLCNSVQGQPKNLEKTTKQTTSKTNVKDQSVQTHSLQKALRELAQVANPNSTDFLPDVRNGLIRVAVLTSHSEDVDLATRQAFSAALADHISQNPNILILEPSRERRVLERFNKTNLPLSMSEGSVVLKSISKSISLGQHLGVRYLILTEISGVDQQTFKIELKTISIKQRGPTPNGSKVVFISKKELERFQQQNIFYEKKLEATWRSAVLPGWGQLYQGRTGTAIAYMSLTTGLMIGGIWSQFKGSEAQDNYERNTQDTVYYRQVASNYYARAQIFWGALGVTWLSATLSAYVQGQDKAHLRLNFDPQHGSLSLSGVF